MATPLTRKTPHFTKRLWLTLTLIGALMFILVGCSAQPSSESIGADSDSNSSQASNSSESSSLSSQPTAEELLRQKVEETLQDLSLEQKVAQLFVVRPESITGVETVIQAGDATKQALASYPVGGIVYFGANLQNTQQTIDMLQHTQSFAQEAIDLPLFIAVDEEGGTVSRIGGAEGFDIPNVGDMATIGATGDPAQARNVATTIATYLKKLGFNVDFAPVADVANNPESDTMRQRSFGADASLVASMVKAEVEGFLNAGILCCAKHFPGIGGAVGDSHDGSISSDKTLDQMKAEELIPFEAAIEAGVPFVMVGHLTASQVTGDTLPASLSSVFMKDVLRDQLGFQGVIITDSLEMGAVSEIYPADQVGVKVLQAGADMILMPPDFHQTYQGIIDAVNNGELPESRIDESMRRILEVKLSMES